MNDTLLIKIIKSIKTLTNKTKIQSKKGYNYGFKVKLTGSLSSAAQ